MLRRLLRLLTTLLLLALALLLVPLPSLRAATPHPTLIVLGAAQYAGRPSPAFQVRLDHALELYRAGGVQTIVVTGGRREGDPYTEGGVGAEYLRRHGVPSGALLSEERSRTTAQNLNYAAQLLPAGTPVTIVTDRAHAPRALLMARRQGLSANANPSRLWDNASPRYLLRERLALLAFLVLNKTE